MKKLIALLALAAAVVLAVTLSTGCAAKSGPYFQKTRQGQAHSQRGRIHNPGDYRYHERHDTGVDSHTND